MRGAIVVFAGGDGRSSFAEFPSGEIDEHGLERRLLDADVGDREARLVRACVMTSGSVGPPGSRTRTRVPSTTRALSTPSIVRARARALRGRRSAWMRSSVSAPIVALSARACRARAAGRGR